MDNEIKLLRLAFLNKEKNQELLAKLERLKAGGSILTPKYDLLKSDYQQKMTAAVSEISIIKNRLNFRLEEDKTRLNSVNGELEKLRARYAAGEFSLNAYKRNEKRLMKNIEEMRKNIPLLQSLVGAKSSSQFAAPGGVFPRWALITTIAGVILCIGLVTSWWIWLYPWPFMTRPATPPATDNITPASPDWAGAVAKVEPAIVEIRSDNVTSAGVIIDKAGFILTTNYVAKHNKSVTIALNTKAEHKGEVIRQDDKANLAIIKATSDNFSFPFLVMGDSETLTQGKEVAAIGYFLDTAGATKWANGTIFAIVKIDGVTHLYTNIPFDASKVGGALINDKGEVVGIIAGRVSMDEVKDSIFAIAINEAKALTNQVMGKE